MSDSKRKYVLEKYIYSLKRERSLQIRLQYNVFDTNQCWVRLLL